MFSIASVVAKAMIVGAIAVSAPAPNKETGLAQARANLQVIDEKASQELLFRLCAVMDRVNLSRGELDLLIGLIQAGVGQCPLDAVDAINTGRLSPGP